MASYSNSSFVPFTTEDHRPQMAPLSASVPIRAPLTHYDDDDDDDFDVSTNATLSDTASHSDASETPSATAAPFLADPESDYASEDDELSPTHAVPLRVTPVAHLSTYDDGEESEMDGSDDEGDSGMDGSDDEAESEMDGDDELSTVVRVPQNSFSAPRIKVLDVEKGEEEEEEEENERTLVSVNSLPISQSLLSDEFSNFSLFNGVCSDNNSIEPEDDIDDSVGIGLDDDDGVLGGRVGYDECSIPSDSDVMMQYSPDKLNNEHFGKVRVVLDELEEGELYEINRNEGITLKMFECDDSIMQRELEVDTKEANHMVDGISVMVDDIDNSLLKSNAEDYSDGRMPKHNHNTVHDLQEQNSQPQAGFSMTDEPVSEETIEYGATQRSVANGSQGFAFAQENECEEPVSMTISMINSKAELHDSSASFESINDACEDKQIQSVESSELLDPTLLQENAYFENDLYEADLGVSEQDDLFCDCCSDEYVETGLNLGDKLDKDAIVELNAVSEELMRDGLTLDGSADAEGLMSIAVEQFKEQISALSILLGSKGSEKNCQQEQLVRSSHENTILAKVDAKGQLTNVACGGESDGRIVTFTSVDESSAVFLNDPGSFSSLLHCKAQAGFDHSISEKEKEQIQRIQDISVKFLRLVLRVNLSLEDSFVSKVLCRLVADIGRRSNQELVIKLAKVSAERLEEDCEDDLDFSLNILVLGKSGVGKSATINSIFGDMKVKTNAFEPATTAVKEVSGTIDGIKIRILDTPGLMLPMKDQSLNRKILSSIKSYMKKFPVDVILYVDRVDSQTKDLNDLPMLKSITSSLSPSIWQRAILTLTHAASTPLDGPSGSPLSYDLLVAQKSYLVQQSIARAVRNLSQLSPGFMCPVSLVENHSFCGEFVLPNGLRWRSQLSALCISLKILSEASAESGPQTLFDQWKHFFLQNDTPPLSHTFSSLLQPHAHLKFKANWN